jgi:hypothetical protein
MIRYGTGYLGRANANGQRNVRIKEWLRAAPSHARACEVVRRVVRAPRVGFATVFCPVPLPQARSRVPVRCICCARMLGFCMMPGWFAGRRPGRVCARCCCACACCVSAFRRVPCRNPARECLCTTSAVPGCQDSACLWCCLWELLEYEFYCCAYRRQCIWKQRCRVVPAAMYHSYSIMLQRQVEHHCDMLWCVQ